MSSSQYQIEKQNERIQYSNIEVNVYLGFIRRVHNSLVFLAPKVQS
jgi:hypothetical protein